MEAVKRKICCIAAETIGSTDYRRRISESIQEKGKFTFDLIKDFRST